MSSQSNERAQASGEGDRLSSALADTLDWLVSHWTDPTAAKTIETITAAIADYATEHTEGPPKKTEIAEETQRRG
jgi:hypothetical protein